MKKIPFRHHLADERFYAGLDPGIRFAVRVLHAAGLDTCQSCAGSGPFGEHSGKRRLRGAKHAYLEPTVEMVCGGDDAAGFHALASLHAYGLPVSEVAIVWNIRNGLPFEKLWRVTFWKPMLDRADDTPMFVHHYQASWPRNGR